MGLLDKLKALLTGGESATDRERGETTVRVERDVRETTAGGGADSAEPADESAETAEEPVAAGTTASASTESLVDEEAEGVEAAEPAEAAGPESDDVEIREAEPDRDAGADDPVDAIKGIGPAYADRLGNAGVHTVADLREADAAELAAATDLSDKRISRWIDRANDY